MKKVLFLMLFLTMLGTAGLNAQVRIGGNSDPNKAAVLDLNADNSATPTGNKGALALPRVELATDVADLNGQRPLDGMMVYNTKTNMTGGSGAGIYYWNTNKWVKLTVSGDSPNYSGSNSIRLTGDSIVRAALTGDVTAAANSNVTTIADDAVTSAKILDGTIIADDIADNTITANKLNAMGATQGQVLAYSGNSWVATNQTGITIGKLERGSFYIGLNPSCSGCQPVPIMCYSDGYWGAPIVVQLPGGYTQGSLRGKSPEDQAAYATGIGKCLWLIM